MKRRVCKSCGCPFIEETSRDGAEKCEDCATYDLFQNTGRTPFMRPTEGAFDAPRDWNPSSIGEGPHAAFA